MVSHCLDIKRLSGKPERIRHIFDIGANNGAVALHYSKEFPWARIFAFEPVQKTYAELQKTIGINPQFLQGTVPWVVLPERPKFFMGLAI